MTLKLLFDAVIVINISIMAIIYIGTIYIHSSYIHVDIHMVTISITISNKSNDFRLWLHGKSKEGSEWPTPATTTTTRTTMQQLKENSKRTLTISNKPTNSTTNLQTDKQYVIRQVNRQSVKVTSDNYFNTNLQLQYGDDNNLNNKHE